MVAAVAGLVLNALNSASAKNKAARANAGQNIAINEQNRTENIMGDRMAANELKNQTKSANYGQIDVNSLISDTFTKKKPYGGLNWGQYVQ